MSEIIDQANNYIPPTYSQRNDNIVSKVLEIKFLLQLLITDTSDT